MVIRTYSGDDSGCKIERPGEFREMKEQNRTDAYRAKESNGDSMRDLCVCDNPTK